MILPRRVRLNAHLMQLMRLSMAPWPQIQDRLVNTTRGSSCRHHMAVKCGYNGPSLDPGASLLGGVL
eukprot:5591711-Amphidinium_carterae.2